MMNKSIRRNVMASAALTAGTTTSQTEKNTWGRGIRFYVTASSVTATGTVDSFNLCAAPPNGGSVIALVGFSAANLLSVAGTWCFDFYPGAWLPVSGLSTSGHLMGAAGVEIPLAWAVQVILGTGNAATIAVDAEILP